MIVDASARGLLVEQVQGFSFGSEHTDAFITCPRYSPFVALDAGILMEDIGLQMVSTPTPAFQHRASSGGAFAHRLMFCANGER